MKKSVSKYFLKTNSKNPDCFLVSHFFDEFLTEPFFQL